MVGNNKQTLMRIRAKNKSKRDEIKLVNIGYINKHTRSRRSKQRITT